MTGEKNHIIDFLILVYYIVRIFFIVNYDKLYKYKSLFKFYIKRRITLTTQNYHEINVNCSEGHSVKIVVRIAAIFLETF